jgi:hypothetical protein
MIDCAPSGSRIASEFGSSAISACRSQSRFAGFSEARNGRGLTHVKAQYCQLIDPVGTRPDPSDCAPWCAPAVESEQRPKPRTGSKRHRNCSRL